MIRRWMRPFPVVGLPTERYTHVPRRFIIVTLAVSHTNPMLSRYSPLVAQPVKSIASEITRYHGIQDVSRDGLTVNKKNQRFVYYALLRDWEIRRLGLGLAKLKFEESAEVTGLLGPTTVDLNMWVADADAGMDMKGLWAMDHYLITSEAPLEAGVYAFHAQSILNSRESDALDKLPKELQVVYPFEVK